MPELRSRRTTVGKDRASSRALWRATGMKDGDFDKPIIAVVNSFTQFVPGHMHLRDVGRMIGEEIERAGGVAKEMNTIAVDDGIAMGHDGMLYSLPSRDLIADSVEYMVNAHRADAMVCISNCDKITPGMLMAAMRLNIPAVFISGGPMEAGRVKWEGDELRLSLVEAFVLQNDLTASDAKVDAFEKHACPTCGSCSGMFTANSMNCLAEALGLAMPGNGSVVATHVERKDMFLKAARQIVANAKRYYHDDDASVLPRSIANFKAFENAMRMDVAMGGSTNTVLHLLAAAREGGVPFTMKDIDRISRSTPHLSKVSPSTTDWFMEDVHHAGGVFGLLGELDRLGVINTDCAMVHAKTLAEALEIWDIARNPSDEVRNFYCAAPAGIVGQGAYSQDRRYPGLDLDRANGCIRDGAHAYSQDGGLAVLYGNLAEDGCIVKAAGVEASMLTFKGTAIVFESENDAAEGIATSKVKPGHVIIVRYEGPRGGPGMQEMLKLTTFLKGRGLDKTCAMVTDGRYSGGSAGLSIGHVSPEAASGGLIGLVENGDAIEIDIPSRTIRLAVDDAELKTRRARMEAKGRDAWKPARPREREVSAALKAYAHFVTSAADGAVRDVERFER